MSGSEVPHLMRDLDWGLATAGTLAGSPAVDGLDLSLSSQARYWADDVQDIVGASPGSRRTVLGWARLQPDPGRWDRAALDRCDRALDAVLEAGMRPDLTLMHLDLPDWLESRGGWLARETSLRFGEYAAEVGRRFGDRVDRWVTTPSLGGILADRIAGMRPPGRGASGAAGLAAVHHALLAHGLAVQALRGAGVRGRIGGSLPLIGAYPATGDPFDRLALERFESWAMGLLFEPMLLGRHMVPEEPGPSVEATGCVRPGDMETIAVAQDFLNLLWHAPCRIAAPENLLLVLPALGCFEPLNEVNGLLVRLGFALIPFDDVGTTSLGLPILPEALADAVAVVHDRYGDVLPPLHITDSGKGDRGGVLGSATEAPAGRRRLLESRLFWLAGLMANGVDVQGYEYWSVMDNLGWLLDYALAYGRAVPETDPGPGPSLPCAWVSAGAFRANRADVPEPVETPSAPGNGARVLALHRR
ncbi:family 1 glycosylhydrolase [Streptomyces sp. NPDC048254]|uniref:family 1 glycosylhydrolase n=1 Tax=Streptomyces sp. NPDC048254 TaxID=3365525 RepID=UPI0037224DB8